MPRRRRFLDRHVALPADHGSWVLLGLPLLIGLIAGGRWTAVSAYLVVASLCAFLVRQPLLLLVKAMAGRRSRDVVKVALGWVVLYGAVAGLHVAGMALRGFGYVLLLALPGFPVFVWYLALVARRAERRQWLVEIAGAGALALAAPAAMWIGAGAREPMGWWLWLLLWGQSAAAIVYTYLRLEQRPLREPPVWSERLRMGAPALMVAGSLTVAVAVAGATGPLPRWLFLAFAVQLAEALYGVARPAIGLKPRAIGFRQLAVSLSFATLFTLIWTRG